MTNQPTNLRPQSVGGLLDTTFRLYRRRFLPLMVLTICIYLPYMILESIFNIHTSTLFSRLAQNVQDPTVMQQELFAQMPTLFASAGFMLLSALVVIPLLFGSILHMVVSIQYDGRETPIGGWHAFLHALRRLLPVLLTNIVRWIIFIVASGIAGGIVTGIGALFGALGLTAAAVGVAVAILSVTAVAFVIWLAVKLAFTSAATLEEGISFFRAMRRSFELAKGNAWRIIGYYIVVQLLVFVVSAGFGLVFSLVPDVIFQTVLTGLVGVFTAPFALLAMANLYLDVRIRTEAPDLAAWLHED